jgi:hypothetical protein
VMTSLVDTFTSQTVLALPIRMSLIFLLVLLQEFNQILKLSEIVKFSQMVPLDLMVIQEL